MTSRRALFFCLCLLLALPTASAFAYETYTFWARADGTIAYTAPSGSTFALDPQTCPTNQWCCTAGKEICYYDFSGNQDDEVQFTLAGAISFTCTVLHFDDDMANKIYFGTDVGNQCESGDPCLKLREEGSTGPPVDAYEGFKILCF